MMSAVVQPLVNLGFVEENTLSSLVERNLLSTRPAIDGLLGRMVGQIIYSSFGSKKN
jgi:hypothetical protein